MEADNNNNEKILAQLKAEQQKIADEVRDLKKNKASKEDIAAAVTRLNEAKAAVQKKESEMPKAPSSKIDFPRTEFNQLLTQRFFLAPSFEIYGGVAGLFDLGPPGCAIKANILSLWRQHFVLTENMLEVDCTSVTPRPVLTTSGHTAKFTDLMVKDVQTGNCFRADHLLEQHLEKMLEKKGLDPTLALEYQRVIGEVDTYDKFQMNEMLQKYGAKAPETGNVLSFPEPFNLMFSTQIGPTGTNPGFLRPETAQGIFVNFKRLLEYNGGKLPFAGAQIGQAFRNEIAPRSGLLRVREFTLAEIEHFVNPTDKSHPKFKNVAELKLNLFPREQQATTLKMVEMTIGDAVSQKIIDNETLGYFIGRTYLFLVACGIRKERLRFRQHLTDEMAHYARDCWDAEIQNSYGWIECVGIADRSCFDLSAHAAETKQPLSAFVEFPEGARNVDTMTVSINKPLIGQTFKAKGQAQKIIQYLENMDFQEATTLESKLKEGPYKLVLGTEEFQLTPDMIKEFKRSTKRQTGAQITPAVIEPSFGIGRILYSLLEHSYYRREDDDQKGVLSLPAAIAPVKVSVLPLLTANEQICSYIPKIVDLLNDAGLSHKVDDFGQTIGKRYARTDEIGVPFGLTIDHETIKDGTVTLRERDSTTQVRVPMTEIASLLKALVDGKVTWAQVWDKYPRELRKQE